MKRTSNFRERILGAEESKRKKFRMLLEELAKPEVDVSTLSKHTTIVYSQMQTQRMMIIPQIIRQAKKQCEPLVLEITKNQVTESNASLEVEDDGGVGVQFGNQFEEPVVPVPGSEVMMSAYPTSDIRGMETGMFMAHGIDSGEVERMNGVEAEMVERSTEEKQFEIIFSDSARPTDVDSDDNHIIHSTTERAGNTAEDAGTVNVPNSFPLFQIVHTGEVPEDVQHEIVRLIRQANPELDLNSITFKFKSPQTVEIIANINS